MMPGNLEEDKQLSAEKQVEKISEVSKSKESSDFEHRKQIKQLSS